jgi:polygalacturonase
MVRVTTFVVFFVFILHVKVSAEDSSAVMLAPGTLSESTAILLWPRQKATAGAFYQVLVDGKRYDSTTRTNCTLKGLKPAHRYEVSVTVSDSAGEAAHTVGKLSFMTPRKGKVFNILDYGAKSDTVTLNTKAIQAAINACTPGGTVYIPRGIFVSGALFLKSDMTLLIAPGAVLKGSVNPDDYLPMILNRFEGWEMKTYASLLNAGTLHGTGDYTVRHLRITGGGTILGGGKRLGEAMVRAHGLRSRGRLICLMTAEDVDISDLSIQDPPSWTIQYIYSHDITCHDLRITSYAHNGDGMDPDSSTDCYIFNCTFSTSDDCIAIKSGKNPEGYYIARPTTHVRITNCNFIRGHGISIGSEMSGGVSDVVVEDCKAANLLHGLQIKGTPERGGYVRNVTVADCQLLQITILSSVDYNNDGAAAPVVPVFENFVFRDIDMSQAAPHRAVMNLNGFTEPGHRLNHVRFSNIILPEDAKIVVNNARDVKFTDVRSVSGKAPSYVLTNCAGVSR